MADGAWQDWVGRSQTLRDTVSAFPARALALTLNHDNGQKLAEGDPVPAIWTWMPVLSATAMASRTASKTWLASSRMCEA